MINKIVKYGIVGIGGMGSNHAKTILSNTGDIPHPNAEIKDK